MEIIKKMIDLRGMRSRILSFVYLMLVLQLCPVMAQAQTAPAMISFQGRLTDTLNNPLSGSHTVTFSIYNVLAGGSALWSETQTGVQVVNGAFSVQLGSVNPVTNAAFGAAAAYLEINVDGTTLSPREQLVSVPYAFNSRLLGGMDSGAFVSTGAVSQTIAGAKTFTGSIDMNGTGRIINLPAPAGPADSATKEYVDNKLVASTADLLTATQTFSGSNTFSSQLNVSSNIYISAGAINLHGNLVTTPAGLLDAAKLANTVPNEALDNSSVTKQGNIFNGAGQLVKLEASGKFPALDGSLIGNVYSSQDGAQNASILALAASTAPLVNAADWNTAYS